MKRILLLVFLLSSGIQSFSQDKKDAYDSSYYVERNDLFALRLYLSRKFTNLVVSGVGVDDSYRFVPNSGRNIGLGFTYQKFTLNIAGPVDFLNPDRQKDFPKYLDLQSHIYPQNMIIDLFGQFYNGYTLRMEQMKNASEDYIREDIKVRKIGVNYNYLFNGEKLSLAAAFNQSEIQKKSAASLLAGFEIYGGSIKGDSLILPSFENQDLINFKESSYLQFGPNVGAAGTLVFGKGFFLTGVVSGGFNFGNASFTNGEEVEKWGIVPSYIFRGFLGYNGEKFAITCNYVSKNNLHIRIDPYKTDLITSNYRINFIYRIKPSEKFKNTFNKFNPAKIVEKVLN